MTISMYQASIPVFNHMFENLIHILESGEAFARDKQFDVEILLDSRLAPDMFPLSRQIQIATDVARRGVARLAGEEPEQVADNEQTLDEFYDRIRSTMTRLDGYRQDQIDGSEDRPISVKVRDMTLNFTGQDFLLTFMIPNIYFHITTAYVILRHNGVALGKADFLGNIGSKSS